MLVAEAADKVPADVVKSTAWSATGWLLTSVKVAVIDDWAALSATMLVGVAATLRFATDGAGGGGEAVVALTSLEPLDRAPVSFTKTR